MANLIGITDLMDNQVIYVNPFQVQTVKQKYDDDGKSTNICAVKLRGMSRVIETPGNVARVQRNISGGLTA